MNFLQLGHIVTGGIAYEPESDSWAWSAKVSGLDRYEWLQLRQSQLPEPLQARMHL